MGQQFHFWVYVPKRTESSVLERNLYTMFIAALLTIAKMWKQSTCPWICARISEMWSIHTMKYYSALQRKETLQYVTTWMTLEDIMLSEINQSQKDKTV